MKLILGKSITIKEVNEAVLGRWEIGLDHEAIDKIKSSRAFLLDKITRSEAPIYGVNTGFGSLCNEIISDDNLALLQENLIKSHACGMGDEVPEKVVRMMMILKIQSLSYGFSGISLEVVERLVELYNKGYIPVVYQLGSLGASGDLAPLAHMSLPLLGDGEVRKDGQVISGSQIPFDPLKLGPKEGLALINGTQFMSAYACYLVHHAQKLDHIACKIGAMSLEAYDGRIEPFYSYSHEIRPHSGQIGVAEEIHDLLGGSEIITQKKEHVQDPYSFRCMPQVHGASRDAFAHVAHIVTTEINSVTDNPNVFEEHDQVLSAGNFHGQPLAINLDYLAIALAELGSISERRVYRLMEGKRGLPAFLVSNAGLNSGMMIAQYTAASIVSQNKQLCTPSSVDTIESSNGQEDHVSMGANGATKCMRVLENVERIYGIELYAAVSGLKFRSPLKTSPALSAIQQKAEDHLNISEEDQFLSPQLNKAREMLDGL